VTAPGAKHPIFPFDILENLDHGIFIPAIEVNGGTDSTSVEDLGDFSFEIDQVLSGQMGDGAGHWTGYEVNHASGSLDRLPP
jgi:hypothetical protein